jgi:hypothetical protein
MCGQDAIIAKIGAVDVRIWRTNRSVGRRRVQRFRIRLLGPLAARTSLPEAKNSEVLIFHRPRDRAYARKCLKGAIASVDGGENPATSCPEQREFAPKQPHRVNFCLPISLWTRTKILCSATPRATQDDRRAPESLFNADALLWIAGRRGGDRFASHWEESYH